MENIDSGLALNSGGATGFSLQTADRTLPDLRNPTMPRIESLSRELTTSRGIIARESLYPRDIDGQSLVEERYLPDVRPSLARSESERSFFFEPIGRTVGDLREQISRADSGRMIETASSNGTNNTGNPATPLENKTPLDFPISDLFKGFFNAPVKGRADKNGQFIAIPPATNSGGSGGFVVLLLLAGLGVGGYYLYQKYRG